MIEFVPHEVMIEGTIDDNSIEEIPNFRQSSSLYKKCFFANLIKTDGKVIKRLFVVKEVDGKEECRVLDNIPEEEKIISWEHYYSGGMMDNSSNIVIHTLSSDSYVYNPGSGFFEPPCDSLATSDDLGYFTANHIVDGLTDNKEVNDKFNNTFQNVTFYKDAKGKDVIMMTAWGETFRVEPIEPVLDSVFTLDNATYFLGKIYSKVRNREDIPVDDSKNLEDRNRLIVIDPTNNEEPIKAYRFPFYKPVSMRPIDKTRAVLTVEAGYETIVNEEDEVVEIPNIKQVLICFPTRQLSACYDSIEEEEDVIKFSKKIHVGDKEVIMTGVLEPDGAMGRSIMTYFTQVKVPEDNDANGISIDVFSEEPLNGEIKTYSMYDSLEDGRDDCSNEKTQDNDWPIEGIDKREKDFSCTKLYKGYNVVTSGTMRDDFSLVGDQNITICAINSTPFLVATLTTGRKCPDPKLTLKHAKDCISACDELAKALDNKINPPKDEPLMQVLINNHEQ